MSRQHRPWARRQVVAWALAVLAVGGAAGAPAGLGGARGDAWMTCQGRVIAALESAGQRDRGAVSAYTGVAGAGAQDAIVARCGYHPETIGPALCESLFQQVYPACREDGFEGMSAAATSWVRIFDPVGVRLARLRRACTQAEPLGRAAFGALVCGE